MCAALPGGKPGRLICVTVGVWGTCIGDEGGCPVAGLTGTTFPEVAMDEAGSEVENRVTTTVMTAGPAAPGKPQARTARLKTSTAERI